LGFAIANPGGKIINVLKDNIQQIIKTFECKIIFYNHNNNNNISAEMLKKLIY
jgi:hypothetical protein